MTHTHNNLTKPLPVCHSEMLDRGWNELDVLFISGDAYIDHPAFGVPLLARFLENHGYRVGIIAQPDWKNPDSLTVMGQPRLFAAISAGAMDSMVNHYTAAKKLRRNDAYTPGGVAGKRPNRATIAYTSAVRNAFKSLPVIIGGIEASLRRLAHYDYWDDRVRRSILIDSKADLLIYGMGEKALFELAERLKCGESLLTCRNIKGTAYVARSCPDDALLLPSYAEVAADPALYNRAFKLASLQDNPYCAKPLAQAHEQRYLVVNPPAEPLSTEEMDALYALPFSRHPHPRYSAGIPAYERIRHSITSHRGCFGGCAFCAITHHQGKTIQSRSRQSILDEVDKITVQKDFYGTISDVGGPTANMYGLRCNHPDQGKHCRRPSCLFPSPCENLLTDDQPAVALLRSVQQHEKVKHVFVASGVRYDLLSQQAGYFNQLVEHHISGLLKVAPESTSDAVTRVMRKPVAKEFTNFLERFRAINNRLGLRQKVVPYLISSHPGCTLNDMIDVALYLKRHQLKVEQVQDFTPTPGSLSTCIYHTGQDPLTGQAVYVPRSAKERRLQKALLLYHLPESREDVLEALKLCRRENLVENLLGRESSKTQKTMRDRSASHKKSRTFSRKARP